MSTDRPARIRSRKLKVVKLSRPKVSDDSNFIETLVWVLGQARAGKIMGYAMVFVSESEERSRTIEAACVRPGQEQGTERGNALHLLGCIRRMEANFMKRNWPDDT